MSNWTDLVLIHGNVEGSRAAFERACEMILGWKHPTKKVRGVRVQHGDGGIDVYVGNLGQSPVDVYQCKYFIEGIGDAQKQQIRDSYKRAVASQDFKVKDWFLCLPVNLSVPEATWFESWAKPLKPCARLVPPSQLMADAEQSGLACSIFQRYDSLKLDWIVANLKTNSQDPWYALVAQTEDDCYKILLTLIRMHHKCIVEEYLHLDALFHRVEAGDKLDACQYLKSVLVGQIAIKHKVWLLNMLNDFTWEPLAYRFIRRYDALVKKAEELDHLDVLSTTEFYSTWALLRSPALGEVRKLAEWTVEFP